MWQTQKAQRGNMSHSFSITELLPFTLCEQEYGLGTVRKAWDDKLCSMWHNSSQETANQQPTNNCTLFCCQKEQLSLSSTTLAEECQHRVLGCMCCLCTLMGVREKRQLYTLHLRSYEREGCLHTFCSTSDPNQERKTVWRKRVWTTRVKV